MNRARSCLPLGPRALAGGVYGRVPHAELVLLGVEPVPVDHRAADALAGSEVLEARDAFGVLEEVGLVEIVDPPVVLPPLGLRLAPVPLEEVREQLARGRCPVVAAQEEERTHEGGDLRGLLLDTFWRSSVAGSGSRRVGAESLGVLVPARLEPLSEESGRVAVGPVVVLDSLQDGRVRVLEPPLVLDDGRPGVDDGPDTPAVEIQRLELLEGIRRRPHLDPLAHDAVQVDEHSGAQELVHLVLASAVAAHQPADRRRLVGGEVEHVQIGVLRAAGHDEVDELLERALLPGGVVPPKRPVGERAAGLDPPDAQEVLDPSWPDERVAFDVEKEIARRRRRERAESEPVLRRPE